MIVLIKAIPVLIDREDFARFSEIASWYIEAGRNTSYVAHKSRELGKVYLHRWLLKPEKNAVIDHADRNGLNNRRANLRIVSRSKNGLNAVRRSNAKHQAGATRGKSGQWIAQIMVHGKNHYLGSFKSEAEAHAAYEKVRTGVLNNKAYC